MLIRVALLFIIASIASSSPAWTHGGKREFGTPINGRNADVSSADSAGAADFTLLVLATNVNAIERAIEQGQAAEVYERADRLQVLLQELLHRSGALDSPERDRAVAAASGIAESGTRIVTGARVDPGSLEREFAELRGLIESMTSLLRKISD